MNKELITKKNFNKIAKRLEELQVRSWKMSRPIFPKMTLYFKVFPIESYFSTVGQIWWVTPYWRGDAFALSILFHEGHHWNIYPLDIFRAIKDIFEARRLLAEEIGFVPEKIQKSLWRVEEDWSQFAYSTAELQFVENILGDYCLEGTTKILLPGGAEKEIREIKEGDIILGVRNGKVVPTRVLGIGKTLHTEIIEFRDGKRHLVTSPEHKIFSYPDFQLKLAKEFNNESVYYYLDDKLGQKNLDRRTDTIPEGKLSEDDSKRNSSKTRKNSSQCSRLCLPSRRYSLQARTLKKKMPPDSHFIYRNGESLYCWNCRWGRNDYDRGKEISTTNDINIQHFFPSQRIFRTTWLSNSSEDKLGRNRILLTLHNRATQYQRIPSCYQRLLSNQEGTCPTLAAVVRTESSTEGSWQRHSSNGGTIQTLETFELKTSTFKVIRKKKTDPVILYDLKTSTGSFFANRILVHNCVNLHIHDNYPLVWNDLWHFLSVEGTFYEKEKALKRDTTFLLYLAVYPELIPGLEQIPVKEKVSEEKIPKIAHIVKLCKEGRISTPYAIKELAKLFHDNIQQDLKEAEGEGKEGDFKCPKCHSDEGWEIVSYFDEQKGKWLDV